MLWWVTILALGSVAASLGDHSIWEGDDWDSSFPIGMEDTGLTDTEGVPHYPTPKHNSTVAPPPPPVVSAGGADVSPTPMTVTTVAEADATGGVERFSFWRDITRAGGGSRRMFGGTRAAPGAAQGRAVALIDSRGNVHCSGAALTTEWILTASHCLTPSVTSARTAADPKRVPLIYIYKHPQYKVEQRAVGGGLEVTSLAHDIGLAQSGRALGLTQLPPLAETLADMERHDLRALTGQALTVYGFGRVEGAAAGGGLFSIHTSVGLCANPAWAPCVCGAGQRGVCAGDSGGPVFYNNTQVAVTSLGPMSCSASEASTSVFTAVRPYVPLIRATVPTSGPGPLATRTPEHSVLPETSWTRQRVSASSPPSTNAHLATLPTLFTLVSHLFT